MPKIDQITMYSQHTHKHQHEFDKDIEVLMLNGNLYQKHERELWEDKFICVLVTKAPTGLNIEFKHYGRELFIRNNFLYLPVKTFSMDTPFSVRFLNISALRDWMKFPYFTQCLYL